MKINIEIDLDDFTGDWSGKGLNELIQDEIKGEVLRSVKKTKEYKDHIKELERATLSAIKALNGD